MTRRPPGPAKARKLSVLFLIPRHADGDDWERAGLEGAVDLRNKILNGGFDELVLVGPTRDTKPSTWTAKIRKYSGEADIVIIEGHGVYRRGSASCLPGRWREYAIGTERQPWRPYLDASDQHQPSYELVILGSCWARRHVNRIAKFFPAGQPILASTCITRTEHVEQLYQPLLLTIARGGDVETVLENAPAGWARTSTAPQGAPGRRQRRTPGGNGLSTSPAGRSSSSSRVGI